MLPVINLGEVYMQYKVFQKELNRMFLEFITEIQKEKWFGKERELVSRFVFSKLIKNIGCCKEFTDPEQIGIEVRVKQIKSGKNEICKDLVIWKYRNQTIWSKDNTPICIIEWKHNNKEPSKYDMDWLKSFTKKFSSCFGIAVNVENEREYKINAVLIECGKIYDENWLSYSTY